jgi:SAM-dependent methyltransferase
VTFEVSATAYARFMGRYSERLAPHFADLTGIAPGQRVLDVGCGPGALAAELVRRLGPESVCAVEPSHSFAAAARGRLPGVDVRLGSAEALPFPDGAFDAALAQLVVHFMTDPVAGLREMGRVTKPGGTVAACVWDYGNGRSPLTAFWRVARELDPAARDGRERAGATEGQLASLFTQAGLPAPQTATLSVAATYPTFDDWWDSLSLGVGPVGDYLDGMTHQRRSELREHCRAALPTGPFEVSAAVWAVRSRV